MNTVNTTTNSQDHVEVLYFTNSLVDNFQSEDTSTVTKVASLVALILGCITLILPAVELVGYIIRAIGHGVYHHPGVKDARDQLYYQTLPTTKEVQEVTEEITQDDRVKQGLDELGKAVQENMTPELQKNAESAAEELKEGLMNFCAAVASSKSADQFVEEAVKLASEKKEEIQSYIKKEAIKGILLSTEVLTTAAVVSSVCIYLLYNSLSSS